MISAMESASVMHMIDPSIQQKTTEAGPPRRKGVSMVPAIENATPMIDIAKLYVDRLVLRQSDSVCTAAHLSERTILV